MSALDHLREETTGQRGIRSLVPFTVTPYDQRTGDVRPGTLDANIEHRLTLTLSQTFWANNAQYTKAKEAARRAIYAHLYGNIHRELECLMVAIYAGSAEDCLAAVERIRKEITP